jgi:hypothetical protein
MNARARLTTGTRGSANENQLCGGVDSTTPGDSVARGACLCGTIHYAVDRPHETLSPYGDPEVASQTGAYGHGFVAAPLVAFRWLAGEEWLTNYDPEDGARRSFCRWCGSSMPVSARDRAAMLLPLASLDMSNVRRPALQAVPA